VKRVGSRFTNGFMNFTYSATDSAGIIDIASVSSTFYASLSQGFSLIYIGLGLLVLLTTIGIFLNYFRR
jgi:hypothetical protein